MFKLYQTSTNHLPNIDQTYTKHLPISYQQYTKPRQSLMLGGSSSPGETDHWSAHDSSKCYRQVANPMCASSPARPGIRFWPLQHWQRRGGRFALGKKENVLREMHACSHDFVCINLSTYLSFWIGFSWSVDQLACWSVDHHAYEPMLWVFVCVIHYAMCFSLWMYSPMSPDMHSSDLASFSVCQSLYLSLSVCLSFPVPLNISISFCSAYI